MPTYKFRGIAFVSGVEITVEAHTLGEAVGLPARDEGGANVDLETGRIEYSWTDLNSGAESADDS